MEFSKEVRDGAYERADGQCECARSACGHIGRCWRLLGDGWGVHPKVPQSQGGAATLDNCEALCATCLRNTRSYRKALGDMGKP